MPFRVVVAVISLLLSLRPAGAAAGPAEARVRTALDAGEPRVEAELVSLPPAEPDGAMRVGVFIEIAPGWHIYARDPGETGLPTTVDLALGSEPLGGLRWPEPEEFRDPDGPSARGYSRSALIWTEVPAAATRARVDVELLACADRCIPAQFSLERALDPTAPADARARHAFASAAATPLGPAAAPGRSGMALLHALFFGLIGGIILNAMPCVLPVLALKLAAAAELAQHSRREAAAHAAAYGAGVLATLQALALVVIALRAAGTEVGWGFQFQDPRFVAVVTAVVVLFGLNLLGIFEITWMPGGAAALAQQATGLRRSFFEGLLAVVLATPCTAPFLGSAVGFAFAAGALAILGVFAAIGIGLALPFVAVVLAPRAVRLVPRPGAWMLELRASLGFLLLASAVWLLWVLGRAAGLDAVAAELALLLALAYAVRALGRVQMGVAQRGTVWVGAAVAVVALAGAGFVGLRGESGEGAGPGVYRVFDAAAVRAAVEAGDPAFVYFTADWCLTCKLNERRVLADARVQAALDASGAARFRADWTQRDERIGRELARHGRAGVPLYLVYAADEPDHPQVLPELLSVEQVLDALQRAAPREPAHKAAAAPSDETRAG